MLNKENIYKEIFQIAQNLNKSNSTYKRADLAYELNGVGVSSDSFEVSILVWEAYQKYNRNKSIRSAFLVNDESKFLIDDYELYEKLNNGEKVEFINELNVLISRSEFDNVRLNKLIDDLKSIDFSKVISQKDLMRFVGVKKASDIYEQIIHVFSKYTEVVEGYDELRNSVKDIIDQYVALRDDVTALYRDHALGLVDVFGDSIKVVSPNLFDFEQIQYLDTTNMLEVVEKEYNKLATSCGVLMQEIGENFKISLKSAVGALGKSKGNKAMIAVAVVEMLGHYIDSSQKSLVLRNEFMIFKDKVNYDIALITGDMKRIMLIHRIINELYIPKANVFYRYSREIMSIEYKKLIDSIYVTPVLKELKLSRDMILDKFKITSKRINDTQKNISYYEESVANNKSFIRDAEHEYKQAKALKPSKPLLAFIGIGRSSYDRKIYEWQQTCIPVIEGFENANLYLKLDQQELQSMREELEKDNIEYINLNEELIKINNSIVNELQVDGHIKSKIAENLESYIQLLFVAKDIIESKVDEKLINVYNIEKNKITELPSEVKNNINHFVSSLKKEIVISEKVGLDNMKILNNDELNKNQSELDRNKYSNTNVLLMTDAQNKLVIGAIDYLKNWTELQLNKKLTEESKRNYEKQLENMLHDFTSNMKDIDNKSVVLMEIMKKINTAENNEQIKKGLIMLTRASGYQFTENDIEKILKGDRIIEI